MATTTQPDTFLKEMSAAWCEYGCTICGRSAMPDAEQGYRVEVHSLNRGHGRHESRNPRDYLGLGGAFVCGHHADVTEHRIDIYENQYGELVWVNRKTGERGTCRLLPEGLHPAFRQETLSRVPTPSLPAAVVVNTPASAQAGNGEVDEAQQRLSAIRSLCREAARSHLAASLLLAQAYDRGDHSRFGLSWSAYVADHVGLTKGTASKMLTVARTFKGAWMSLPEDQQAELSLERTYLAAKLVEVNGLAVEEALSKAVSQPAHHLVAERLGEEPVDQRPVTCPDCGEVVWHRCRA
jgi:hypothetical protein